MINSVCEGAPTIHFGVVKTASSTFKLDDRKVALIDDIVTCPERGDNPIIEHGEGYGERGRKRVVDGCRTQCRSRVTAGTDRMKIL
jgi:uncharacterized Zn-binding protein involved in type VI secretion